jgi:hypothetical protein
LADFEREHRKELTELRLLDYVKEQATEIRANMDFMAKYAPEIFIFLEEWKERQQPLLDGRQRKTMKKKATECQMME